MTAPAKHYIGRFAPSPSGPLHFGSLVAALGSYLDARAHNGQWLVRMEDIDPPREQPGAADDILRTLDEFGLHWDGDVLYQSHRDAAYQEALSQLHGQLFYCTCTRAQLQPFQGRYPGTCYAQVSAPSQPSATRLRGPDGSPPPFRDVDRGVVQLQRQGTGTDPVLKRKDGLWAYLLAVVVDDAAQGVTRVVRGHDLFTTTPLQVYLQQRLGVTTPDYLHLPVVNLSDGRKLSKQNHAPAIQVHQKHSLLRDALRVLGLNCPDHADPLVWGQQNWLTRAPGKTGSVILPETVSGAPC